MNSKIEKNFFDTFGIEPRFCIASCYKCQHYSYDYCYNGYCILDSDYDNCGVAIKQYPQITDHILLELICIIGSIYICVQDREALKEHILVQCMNTQMHGRDIKQQVRTLFEEI